ncbi:MAG: hypothetical protein B7X67_28810 [Rhizobiales bacterium 39-66-18]|nr:MAG: hypothetical protein B7X67_28810 [Rhizobiales bacterium 39-66-18]
MQSLAWSGGAHVFSMDVPTSGKGRVWCARPAGSRCRLNTRTIVRPVCARLVLTQAMAAGAFQTQRTVQK